MAILGILRKEIVGNPKVKISQLLLECKIYFAKALECKIYFAARFPCKIYFAVRFS